MKFGIMDGDTVIARLRPPTKLLSHVPTTVTDSRSLKRVSRRSTAQRWELETAVQPLGVNAPELYTLLITKGSDSIFKIAVPQPIAYIDYRPIYVSGMTCVGEAGDSAVEVIGLEEEVFLGAYLRFSNHPKLYMLKSARVGNGPLMIYPALRESVTGATVHLDSVYMEAYWDDRTMSGMVWSGGRVLDVGTLKFVEAL